LSEKRVAIVVVFVVAAVALTALMVQRIGNEREAAQIKAAPHVTSIELIAICKSGREAQKQVLKRLVVVTGYVDGADEGLIGDGALHMGNIECDVDGHYGPCKVGSNCTVVGTCEGIDQYGLVLLREARALQRL
jgi:hypothetical protein